MLAFGDQPPEGEGPEACEVWVRQAIVNQRVAPCPLEVRSSAAAWVDGRLIHWCSTQSAHGVRDQLVATYGLEPDQVRVIAPDVGGGFGAKASGHPEDVLLGWLARHCGRPVRWVETRSENMVAMVHGRAQYQEITVGGRRDGTIEAYHLAITQDAGAYPALGALLPGLTRMMAAGTYGIPAVTCEVRSVVTNSVPTGGVPGRGPARGHRRRGAGRRPVRGRGRPRPRRGAPAQPAAPVR